MVIGIKEEKVEKGAKLTKGGDVDLRTEVGKGFKALLTSMGINYREAVKTQKIEDANWKNYGDQLVREEVQSREVARQREETKAQRKAEVDKADKAQQILQLDGINNEVELEASKQVKENTERKRKEKHDKEVARMTKRMESGPFGFKAMISATREGWEKLITEQKTTQELFGDMKDSFSQDISMVTGALSPLMDLPGVNAAISVVKFLFMMLWKGVQKFIAWNKARAAKNAGEDRLDSLKGAGGGDEGGVDIPGKKKGGIPWMKIIKKSFGIILSVVVGFFVMIGNFVTEVIKPFKAFFGRIGGKVKGLFKGFKMPQGLTKGIQGVKGFFGKIGKFFNTIFKPFKAIGNILGKLLNPKIIGFMGKIGSVFGKLFWPITVLMGTWEAIKGFIAGFKDTEGGIVEKMIGGIGGAIGSLIDFIVMWPLDLIKDLVAWVGEKMGFDMSAVKDFSFSDLWADIWGNFMEGISSVVRFFVALGKAAWAGLKGLGTFFLGGEGPREAFNRVFAEEMAKPSGSKSRAAAATAPASQGTESGDGGEVTDWSADDADFDEVPEEQNAYTRALARQQRSIDSLKSNPQGRYADGSYARPGQGITDGNRQISDLDRLAGGGGAGGTNNVAVDGRVTVNNRGAKIFLEDPSPRDQGAAAMAEENF